MKKSLTHKHVHIVGCSPRSGTSLLHEMICTCFHIDYCCAHEESYFKSFNHPGLIICTKHPREIIYAKWLLLQNPNLYIVYLLRDPRDVIVSKHGKDNKHYYSSLHVWNEFEDCRKKLTSHPRFIVIKYEDLVTTPNQTQEKLAQKLQFLKKKYRFSEFHKHSKPTKDTELALNSLRAVDTSGIGRWHMHLPRIKAQLQRHGDCSDSLIELEYENNDSWKNILNGVIAAAGDSLIDNHYSSKKTVNIRWRIFRKIFFHATFQNRRNV